MLFQGSSVIATEIKLKPESIDLPSSVLLQLHCDQEET